MNVPTKAPDLLKRAADIMEERGKQYDQEGGERSMAKVIAAFNAITGRDLTEQEGWTLMAVLKLVRFFQNTAVAHRDSLEDLIAYGALLAESALDGVSANAPLSLPPIRCQADYFVSYCMDNINKDDCQQCPPTK